MFPILGESLLRSTVGLVNIVFLSRISTFAVSSVSIGNQYIMLCQLVAMAVATGTIICMNQAIGMKSPERANKLGTIALAINIVLGFLFGGVFIAFSKSFVQIMAVSESTASMATSYMRIVGGGMVFQCLQMTMCNIGRSLGKTRMPLIVHLIMNLVNLLGCYLVVFQKVPITTSTVEAIAFVNVASQLVAMLLAGFYLSKTSLRVRLSYLVNPIPWADLKLAVSIGIPSGLNNIAYSMSQIVTTSLISQTGDTMVAAKVFVSQLVGYVALVGMASAQASNIMIGYRIGAGDYEDAMRLRRKTTRVALSANAAFSILLMCFRYQLLGILTNDAQIIRIAANIMLLDFFVELGRALNNTLSGALQAVGDVKYQLIINQSSGWLIAVGLSYLLGISLGLGLYGIWIAFALDEATRGIILLIRWRSRKWQPKAEARRAIIAGA